MKKDYEIIKTFLKDSSNIDDIWESEALIWIDWREYDEDIIHYFNNRMENKIEVEFVDNGKDYGEDILLRKGDKKFQIPYNDIMERDITIKYMNDFINPEYQIRWFIESLGSDTLAFTLLTFEEWAELEQEFGRKKLGAYFLEVNLESKMFNLDMGEVTEYLKLRENNKEIESNILQELVNLKNLKKELEIKRNSGKINLKDYHSQKKELDEKTSNLISKYSIIL